MAKSTDDALHILDGFDVPDAPAPPKSSSQAPIEGDAAEALAFLDELTTQKPAAPNAAAATLERKQSAPLLRPSSRASLQAPTQRRSVEQTRAAIAAARSGSPAPDRDRASATPSPAPVPAQQQAQSSGGWGWGSVWNAASAARTAATAAVQQARTVVDEQVKHLPNNEQARKWGEGMMEYVKQAQLDKIAQEMRDKGLATFTDILNVVAPPISEHEVIQVWLSHDMVGYDGVENLVYRALARIMEQVEGGDLVVNKGNESRPKEGSDESRNLNTVDGQDAALKLAKANLEELAKIKAADKDAPKPESSLQNPTTYSSVYLRIQPFFATHSLVAPPAAPEDEKAPAPAPSRHLHFLLYLQDPNHKLEHATVSQAVPERWLELWDEYDWVEDLVAESLRVSTEIIGQEYVVERMGWGTKKPSPIERAVDVSAQEEAQVEKS